MKKISFVFIFTVLAVFYTGLYAQQMRITNVGVVDTGRVYTTYFRESSAVRTYDSKKADFQAEVDKLTAELQNLQDKKIAYEKSGNESAALRTESEITKKADFLTAYTASKNMEPEKQLYKVISHIAESDGYTLILSLQQANGILWYSPTVDITEKVIAELGRN